MTTFELAQKHFEYTKSVRRHLHQIPELAFEEHETGRFIAESLKSLGYLVQEGVGGTGLTALFDSGNPGKTVLLRFDMDAVPIQEQTSLNFASKNETCMHACGHDGHMAIGLTLAKLLAENPGLTVGKILFAFQPAEEICQGALAMIADGLLDEVHVDKALSTHLWSEKPFSWIGIPDGGVMAGSSDLTIHLQGKGGHAGKPENSSDPLLAAAHIIVALQSVISRSLSANQDAVLSICKISASDRPNIIADKVSMAGTLRCFDAETLGIISKRITEIVDGIASSFNVTAEVLIEQSTIPVMNDAQVATITRQALEKLAISNDQIKIDPSYKTMLSEDFSYILERVPGAMILVGAGETPSGSVIPHHHPKFDIDERAMNLAVVAILETIQSLTRL